MVFLSYSSIEREHPKQAVSLLLQLALQPLNFERSWRLWLHSCIYVSFSLFITGNFVITELFFAWAQGCFKSTHFKLGLFFHVVTSVLVNILLFSKHRNLNGCLHSTLVNKTSLNEPVNSIASAWLLIYLIATSPKERTVENRKLSFNTKKKFLHFQRSF